MARLLGEKYFPSSVQTKRRQLRERALDLREPIRRRRQENVPGPDVIGSLESKVTNLRDQFVTRDSLLAKVRDRRGNGESTESETNGETSTEDDSSSRGSSAERQNVV